MARPPLPQVPQLPRFVDAADYLGVLWTYLTEALCAEVFAALRERERERKWTLFTLMQFWVALLHDGPEVSQTRAVANCARGHPLYPLLTASPESFFQRVQALRPAFFGAVFARVSAAIRARRDALPVPFAAALPVSAAAFPEIYCADASRLDTVAHRVKLLRRTTKAVLPGSVEALYDLRRGCLRALHFDPDGARAEAALFPPVLAEVPPGALLLLDRAYATPAAIATVLAARVELVARARRDITRRRLAVLRRVRAPDLYIEDTLVALGQAAPGPVVVRHVRIRLPYKGAVRTLTFVTTVLDPALLAAEHLAALYAARWSVERMFLTMKATLHLNRLYNSAPAAVGQQVYATALVYNALRLAQAELAHRLQLAPERLSPEKLFPRLMERLEQRTWIEAGVVWHEERLRATHPEVAALPRYDPAALAADLAHHPRLRLVVADVLCEPRPGKRKKRRYCVGRHRHTTFAKLPGGKRYLKS
jgi:hypothetical protein